MHSITLTVIGLVLAFSEFGKCIYDKKCSRYKITTNNVVNETRCNVYTYTRLIVNNESVSVNTCEARRSSYRRNFSTQVEHEKEMFSTQPNPTLNSLTNYLFGSLPPFDLSSSKGVTQKCKTHSDQYLQGLRDLKLWALKMYDSSAKIPSGILNGNINQLGDFDSCLSVKSDDSLIQGQYCLAYLQVEPHRNTQVNSMYNLIYSHTPFRSKLTDPGHRVPRYSSINWALCVPDSCSSQDVEAGVRQSVQKIFNGTDLEIQVKMDSHMCQKLENKPLPHSTVLAIIFFLAIIVIACASTVYDCYTTNGRNDLLVAFSLKKNFSALMSTTRSSNDIKAIHGVRFINGFILIFAHKSMALFFIPYMNRTEMSEITGKSWTVLGRAASLYTDPFIMIAGTLTAYSLFSKLQRTNKINILEEYVSRLFRIIPALAALIAFCTLVLPWLNSGPQWNLVVTHHSDICKKYWWRNLLFIHNYYGFKDMCLTHTHHVGIDTQLFLVSPIMVLLIWKWQKRGIAVLATWAVISTIMRYYATYTKKLSNFIHYGTSVEQLFSTADNMYILPSHRITVYVMGILLGYALQQYKNVKLSSFQISMGNAIAVLSFCVSFFGPAFMGDINYVYNAVDAAWYAAFAPISWCWSFAWVIFITHNGYSTTIGRIFSWKGFLIWTRISYAVYLTQFPTFFYNVGVNRTADHYGFFSKNLNISECLWIAFLSVLLTVLFELPFQNIRNVMLKKRSHIAKVEHKIKIN